IRPQSIQRTTVNGLPAAYGTARVASGNGQVDVTVFAYEFASDRAYHFLAITPAGQTSAFNDMFASMQRIDSQTAANVIPRVVDVVTVGSGDTVASLARRMAYSDNQIDRFRVLNGLTSNDGLSVGQKVKIVVRGR
ncbi:MAG: LysM peptidoglycan-binding domain-containing protein, partial [Qipengyuania citrea]